MANRSGPPKSAAAKSGKRRRVRRRMMVNTPFQVRLLKPLLVGGLVLAAMTAGLIFLPLYQSASLDPSPMAQALLREQLLSIQVRFWPLLILAGALAGLYTLAGSGRIAGPLLKLKRTLTQLAMGEFPRIRFRRNDQFREFEEITNRLSERMEQLAASSERKLAAVESHVEFMKSRVQTRDLSKKEILDDLNALLDQVGQVQVGGENAGRGKDG